MRTLRLVTASASGAAKLLVVCTEPVNTPSDTQGRGNISIKVWDANVLFGGVVVQPEGSQEWLSHFRDAFQSQAGSGHLFGLHISTEGSQATLRWWAKGQQKPRYEVDLARLSGVERAQAMEAFDLLMPQLCVQQGAEQVPGSGQVSSLLESLHELKSVTNNDQVVSACARLVQARAREIERLRHAAGNGATALLPGEACSL
jgi:hypothetical protein